MSKYHSKKVKVDGITFDSIHEAKRFKELQLLDRAGKIRDLKLQVKFQLIPAQYEQIWDHKKHCYRKGKCLEREVNYFADFTYYDENGEYIVEDAKGIKTKDYILKRKLMLYVHHKRIVEV